MIAISQRFARLMVALESMERTKLIARHFCEDLLHMLEIRHLAIIDGGSLSV
jgi:hypothetical protein